MKKIAFVGNPNTGKTTLYNKLTKSLEKEGNFHGITVDAVSKCVTICGQKVEICDLPGLYSLTTVSFEEDLTRDRVLNCEYDLYVNVCNANTLQQNLYLCLQLVQMRLPVVLVVNMIDEFSGKIDANLLQKRLGLPVVLVSARKNIGLQELQRILVKNVQKSTINLPHNFDILPILAQIEGKNRTKICSEFIAFKLLEQDEHFAQLLGVNVQHFGDYSEQIVLWRHKLCQKICQGAVQKSHSIGVQKFDKLAMHRFFGFVVFFVIMLGVFALTFGLLGKWISFAFGAFFQLLQAKVSVWLQAREVLCSFVCNALLGGVGAVFTFLPQVILLYLFLAILEDSGYLSRAAFIFDGVFAKIGLSGRAVFSLLSGFGCSAAAVVTARGQDNRSAKIKTILVTPFLSCSARMPIYTAIGAAFFLQGNFLLIFLLYLLGCLWAIFWAKALGGLLKNSRQGFVSEVAPYRKPCVLGLLKHSNKNILSFVKRTGTTIFLSAVCMWFLSHFDYKMQYLGTQQGSMLEQGARLIAPILAPIGCASWQAVSALLMGFLAKEAVISSLASMGVGLDSIFLTPAAAFSFLVFSALYVPCAATLAAIAHEAGKRWAVFSALLHFASAYASAFFAYRVLLCVHTQGKAMGIILMWIVVFACIFVVFKRAFFVHKKSSTFVQESPQKGA